MSVSYSQQTFNYSGKRYTFVVQLQSGDGTVKVLVDNNAIRCFEYSSQLNELVLAGQLVFVDTFGKADALLEKQQTVCTVMLCENEQQTDGPFTTEKLSDTRRFEETFIVQNMQILDRDGDSITYKIDLVGSNAYKCMSVIEYSNYSKQPESIIDIFRSCLQISGIETDDVSFGSVKTDVKMKYITGGNDTIVTVQKYLFSRLFYFSDQLDDAMKFVVWDEHEKKCRMFDISNKDTFQVGGTVMLSMMKSNLESLNVVERQQLGSVTKMPQTSAMRAFFDVVMHDYDYGKNEFSRNRIDEKSQIGYFNQTFDSEPSFKMKRVPNISSGGSSLNFVRDTPYWNNDIDMYSDFVKNLAKNNAILVDTPADMFRKPGQLVDVMIDRGDCQSSDENKDSMRDSMTRYRGLEGKYFTYRVRHIIQPAEQRYKQALTLVRNYTIDLENKQS